MSQMTRLTLFSTLILTCISAALIAGAHMIGGVRVHPELLAFVPGNQAEQAIMLVDVTNGAAVILTHDDGPAFRPSWSPDGRLIAYLVQYPLHEYALWVVIIDSTGREVDRFYIAPNLHSTGGLTWSPDGTRLAFGTEDMLRRGESRLYMLDIQSGAKAMLRIPVGHALRGTPIWSQDGSAVTLLTSIGGLTYLTTTPLDPALRFAVRQLTNRHYYIALSPQLDQVIVSDNVGMPGNLGIVDLATGDYTPYPADAPFSAWTPAWSPNGEALLIISEDIYLVSLGNTSPPRRLIALPGAEYDPALRP